LEFGRYGAEGLGKLVESKSVQYINSELRHRLAEICYKVLKTPKYQWTEKIVKGKKVSTNPAGEKIIEDASGKIVYERKLPYIREYVEAEDGTPLLRFDISRQHPAKSATSLYMKPLENGKFTPIRSMYKVYRGKDLEL